MTNGGSAGSWKLPGYRRTKNLLQWIGLLKNPKRFGPELTIPGLQHDVDVSWDDIGVPHITAQTMQDALFSQGLIHGRQRAFQMDLSRRIPSGTLSELLGSKALDYDRFMRRLNLARWAAAAETTWSDNTREYVEAYVNGVNRALEMDLAPEYRLLKTRPRPWTVHDTNLVAYHLAWGLNSVWHVKWGFERLADVPQWRDLLFDLWSGTAETIVPNTGKGYGWAGVGVGSNNWAVDGKHSETGSPLLANDPHLMPQFPSIWYEMFIEGGNLRSFGATLPGAPGVIIGQNQHIGWGVTNVDPDVQDLYRVVLDPDGQHYRVDEETIALGTRQEIIRVKGRPDEEMTCLDTVWGPVIHEEADGSLISLRWTGFQALPMVQSVLRLNRAHDWETFTMALAEWWVPAQNFVYADRGGHIGYICAGKIPTRKQPTKLGFWDGNTREGEWTGFIEWTSMPRIVDPNSGIIVTANNPVAGEDHETPFFGRFSMGARARRIKDLLNRQELHNKESLAAIQQDVYSAPLAQLTERLLAHGTLSPRARKIFEEFDGRTDGHAVAPTLLYLFLEEVLPSGLKDALNRPFMPGSLPQMPGAHPYPERLWGLLGENLVELVNQVWNTLDISQALKSAEGKAEAVFGPDSSRWTWGRAHRTVPFHPMAQNKLLEPLFGRIPIAMPGDFYTPLQAAFPLNPDLPWPRTVAYMPSYRQILDLGSPSESVAIHLTGQSGHPASNGYDNLLHPYLAGHYFPIGPGMGMIGTILLRPGQAK